MDFEPAWVSSIAHLSRFDRVYRDASWLRRALGTYRIPDGFPYSQITSGWPMRFPVTMFAVGRISIDKDAVTFASTTPFSRYRNIAANFNFAFHANDITQITRYDSPSPVAKYFNLPFARFRTRASGVLADLLLCVGGQGPRMGLIRRRNADLFAELAKSFPQVSDGLTKPSA